MSYAVLKPFHTGAAGSGAAVKVPNDDLRGASVYILSARDAGNNDLQVTPDNGTTWLDAKDDQGAAVQTVGVAEGLFNLNMMATHVRMTLGGTTGLVTAWILVPDNKSN